MNKKVFLFFTAIIASTTMVFVSCDGDDDSGDAKGGTPASIINDKDGNPVRLKSVGNVWFEYNQDGSVVRFGNNENSYSVTGNAFSVDGNSMSYKFGMNSKGFIKNLTMEFDVTDNSEGVSYRIKGNGTTSYSYNSSDQLVGITHTYKADLGNGLGKATYEGTQTNTWQNGNLVKMVLSANSTEPEVNATYGMNWTISYGSLTNTIKQFPLQLGNDATSIGGQVGFGILSLVGLYGVGPANLPSEMITEIIETNKEPGMDAYTDKYKSDLTFEFTQNSNGTIATEKVGSPKSSGSITYVYKYGETRAAFPEQGAIDILPTFESIKKMFHHKKQ